MTLLDLLWSLPLLFAIAVVLGTAGQHGADDIARTIRQRFFQLLGGLVLVGLFVRAIVLLFA